MPTRSKGSPKPSADPFDAVKPLIVLGLLGMILYGAYSVIRRGPAGASGSVVAGLEPPAVAISGDAPPFAPSVAVAPPSGGTPSVPGIAAPDAAAPSVLPSAVAAASTPSPTAPTTPPPLYLKAVPAAPPVADTAITPAPPASPPFDSPAIAAPESQAAAVPPDAREGAAAVERPSAAFAAAWTDAHEKLAAARYAEALGVLSAWYDDPSLGPEESLRLEELLGQLAGTVIYSQEDHLLPPHIVAAGENLREIAAGLNVPWQVLGKINGVDAPARLVPGEPLKVVAGPFDGVVSLSRRRLSLQLKGNYAGSFPVVVGQRVQQHVGTTLAVQRVRRGARAAAAPVSATAGPVRQVAHDEQVPAAKQIVLAEGLVIEAADDPTAVSESAAATSLIVSARDLDELVDILGDGSRVFVRP